MSSLSADTTTVPTIETATVAQASAAIATFTRILELIQGKSGPRLMKALKKPPELYASNPAEAYKDGLNAGLEVFPDTADVFTLKEVLEAVYGKPRKEEEQ
jgi:hypothetical protein